MASINSTTLPQPNGLSDLLSEVGLKRDSMHHCTRQRLFISVAAVAAVILSSQLHDDIAFAWGFYLVLAILLAISEIWLYWGLSVPF